MVTAKIVLDNRRKSPDDIYSVKLRVTYNRQQKYYLTGFKMTSQQFEETMKPTPKKKYETDYVQLDSILTEAKSIIRDLKPFTFLAFEKKLLHTPTKPQGLFELFEQAVARKLREGSISTAINYRCSMRSLKKFNSRLSLADITPETLKGFEKALLAEGKSSTTVGIYMRPLRCVINEAIDEGLLPRDNYPFGRRKYVIPEGRNPKKALDQDEFHRILAYRCDDPKSFEARSLDFFTLSYLCQGMNIKDLLLLKKDQLKEDHLHFVREKTKETSRHNPVLVIVPLLEEAKAIIQKWSKSAPDSHYVFGFVKPEMDDEQVYKTVQQFVQVTNKNINDIAGKVGIDKRVTTYVARHQFSKAIIEGGESVAYLSECLGHKSIRTTQHYVQSFNLGKKQEIARKLLLKSPNV